MSHVRISVNGGPPEPLSPGSAQLSPVLRSLQDAGRLDEPSGVAALLEHLELVGVHRLELLCVRGEPAPSTARPATTGADGSARWTP